MHDKAIALLLERKTLGLTRYGTTLQAFNGRDALRDAVEEVTDLLVYLLQVREERDAVLPAGCQENLDAVLRLHAPVDSRYWAGEGNPASVVQECGYCSALQDDGVDYPCATARAAGVAP